jgi:hypothetical protein
LGEFARKPHRVPASVLRPVDRTHRLIDHGPSDPRAPLCA